MLLLNHWVDFPHYAVECMKHKNALISSENRKVNMVYSMLNNTGLQIHIVKRRIMIILDNHCKITN